MFFFCVWGQCGFGIAVLLLFVFGFIGLEICMSTPVPHSVHPPNYLVAVGTSVMVASTNVVYDVAHVSCRGFGDYFLATETSVVCCQHHTQECFEYFFSIHGRNPRIRRQLCRSIPSVGFLVASRQNEREYNERCYPIQ